MKPLFLVVECPVDDTLDKASCSTFSSVTWDAKKADSHTSLDPRKITISHLYALQEQKKIEEFFKFFSSPRLKLFFEHAALS